MLAVLAVKRVAGSDESAWCTCSGDGVEVDDRTANACDAHFLCTAAGGNVSGDWRGSTILAPFGVRNFRFQWPGDLMTSLAFEMETLILGWYVLVESGSVQWLTAFGALMFHGTLLSPMLGVIGDRIGHRNLLCCMRAAYLLFGTMLMLSAFSGFLSVGLVLGIAALSGAVRPSDLAVRSATVAASVSTPMLVGALGISRCTSDMARICGALSGAGLLATLGMGPAYCVIAGCYALGLLFTMLVRPVPPAPSPATMQPSPWRDLLDGLAYVWSTPRLLAAMWLAFLMNMTTLPMSGGLLPFVARGVYGTDQTGLGYLSASFAFGALLGSIALSVAGARVKPARMMMITALLWCAVLVVFAVTKTAAIGSLLLIAAGLLQSLSMVTMAVMLLKTSEERLRGRVMGVRMLAIFSQTFGLLVAGLMIERYGFQPTALLYATGALACTLAIALYWQRDLWPIGARANQGS